MRSGCSSSWDWCPLQARAPEQTRRGQDQRLASELLESDARLRGQAMLRPRSGCCVRSAEGQVGRQQDVAALQAGKVAHLILPQLELEQRALGPRQQRLAGVGEAKPASAAIEEPYPERSLEQREMCSDVCRTRWPLGNFRPQVLP